MNQWCWVSRAIRDFFPQLENDWLHYPSYGIVLISPRKMSKKNPRQIYSGKCNLETSETGINETKWIYFWERDTPMSWSELAKFYVFIYFINICLHSHGDTDVKQITYEYKMISYLQYDDGTDNGRFIPMRWEGKKGWWNWAHSISVIFVINIQC